MATDEEKNKINKLLQGVEVPEVKLTERCSSLVNEFHKRFSEEVEKEVMADEVQNNECENPFRVDPGLLEENEKKLRELLSQNNRVKKQTPENIVSLTEEDPKRPWRTNSNKEKLLRIDGELRRHLEKSSQAVAPLNPDDMKKLVTECREETRVSAPVTTNRLRDTVDAAKKNLPNFQYKKIENTTATAILAAATSFDSDQPPEYNNNNIKLIE